MRHLAGIWVGGWRSPCGLMGIQKECLTASWTSSVHSKSRMSSTLDLQHADEAQIFSEQEQRFNTPHRLAATASIPKTSSKYPHPRTSGAHTHPRYTPSLRQRYRKVLKPVRYPNNPNQAKKKITNSHPQATTFAPTNPITAGHSKLLWEKKTKTLQDASHSHASPSYGPPDSMASDKLWSRLHPPVKNFWRT